ncbi:hypothetical protein WJX72_007529 [[Myrmecia] bisecta]|uniref:Uncharacterized protein n=1 Tax=[Myrmecia] bisecta TaxID=41462 RepID=A0AAW1PWM3_9CHLO
MVRGSTHQHSEGRLCQTEPTLRDTRSSWLGDQCQRQVQTAPARHAARVSRVAPRPVIHCYGRVDDHKSLLAIPAGRLAVLRNITPPKRGAPQREPWEFLQRHGGKSLRQRVVQKAVLAEQPINRDPAFQPGNGGIKSPEQFRTRVTQFQQRYEAGDIDFLSQDSGGITNHIRWRRPLSQVDVARWLPVFIEGICGYQEPYRFLAIKGATDMIEVAGPQLVPMVHSLSPALKAALDTREPATVAACLGLIKHIMQTEHKMAAAFLPYLRYWSQVLVLFRSKAVKVSMGYNSRETVSLPELVTGVLSLIEEHGRSAALPTIKKHIPGWVSSHQPLRCQHESDPKRKKLMPYTLI